jgi:hypothetical protein
METLGPSPSKNVCCVWNTGFVEACLELGVMVIARMAMVPPRPYPYGQGRPTFGARHLTVDPTPAKQHGLGRANRGVPYIYDGV